MSRDLEGIREGSSSAGTANTGSFLSGRWLCHYEQDKGAWTSFASADDDPNHDVFVLVWDRSP